MDEEEKAREYFSIFVFKVEPCPQKNKHPWDSCSYCHPQENARRRDVRRFRYLAEACPDYKLHGFCALGNDCPFAHGVFEINLHPSKYRTQMCTEGHNCKRKICFFAHNEHQLRQPDYSYGYRNTAEAECVKEGLLNARKLTPQMVHVRAGGLSGPPHLHRLSPSQAAPATPPQGSPPRLFSNPELHSDSIRNALTGHLTNAASFTGAEASYSLPLLDHIKKGAAWTPVASFDSPPRDGSPLADMLPLAPDLSPAQLLRTQASQMTRSLPSNGGPRISMKVRRELGMQLPGKPRSQSLPGANNNAMMGSSSMPSCTNGYPVGTILEPAATSALMGSLPSAVLPALQHSGSPMSGLGQQSAGFSQALSPHRAGFAPQLLDARFMVASPLGVRMSLDEALAASGLAAEDGCLHALDGLRNMAVLLEKLHSLGYTLASEQACKPGGDVMDADHGSGKSSPDFHSNGGLQSLGKLPFQLNLGLTASDSLATTPSAAVLAGLGLNLSADVFAQ